MAALSSYLPSSLSFPSLSPATIALTLLGLILLRNVVTRIRRWHRLRHIPGPAICGWTSLWLTWQYKKGTIQYIIVQLSEKYGPLVRIGPNEVVCVNLDQLLRITSAKSRYTKDDWYILGRTNPPMDNAFSTTDPELRKRKLRITLPAVSATVTGILSANSRS